MIFVYCRHLVVKARLACKVMQLAHPACTLSIPHDDAQLPVISCSFALAMRKASDIKLMLAQCPL